MLYRCEASALRFMSFAFVTIIISENNERMWRRSERIISEYMELNSNRFPRRSKLKTKSIFLWLALLATSQLGNAFFSLKVPVPAILFDLFARSVAALG